MLAFGGVAGGWILVEDAGQWKYWLMKWNE